MVPFSTISLAVGSDIWCSLPVRFKYTTSYFLIVYPFSCWSSHAMSVLAVNILQNRLTCYSKWYILKYSSYIGLPEIHNWIIGKCKITILNMATYQLSGSWIYFWQPINTKMNSVQLWVQDSNHVKDQKIF